MKFPSNIFLAFGLAASMSACGVQSRKIDKREANHKTEKPEPKSKTDTDSKKEDPASSPKPVDTNTPVTPGVAVVDDESAKALIGSWVSDCVDVTKDDGTYSVNSKSVFKDDGTFAVYSYMYAGTTNCDDNTPHADSVRWQFMTRFKGSYKVGIALDSPDGAVEIDYVVDKISMAAASSGGRKKLAQREICGIEDWQKPEGALGDRTLFFKVLNGLDCKVPGSDNPKTMPVAGDTIKDIFIVSGSEVQFGLDVSDADSDGSIRPDGFNEHKYIRE